MFAAPEERNVYKVCFAPMELGLDWDVFGYKRSAPTELRLVLLSGRRKRGVSAFD